MGVTNQTIGADVVQAGGWAPGIGAFTGAGVGIAVIDSGVAMMPELRGRIIASKDFTDDRGLGLDQHGHGTHVAGHHRGVGREPVRRDARRGAGGEHHQPEGAGRAGQGPGGRRDPGDRLGGEEPPPLQHPRHQHVARRRGDGKAGATIRSARPSSARYRAGIVVVASAGNYGKTADGRRIYGAITTPGISPFAITVGALNTKGTPWHSDDEVASYSSKGPTAYDRLLKPDLVAPGNKILGLAAPGSTLVREHPELLIGAGRNARLQLSGTSMASAVVAGSVAVLNEARVGGTERIRRVLQQNSIRIGAVSLSLERAL